MRSSRWVRLALVLLMCLAAGLVAWLALRSTDATLAAAPLVPAAVDPVVVATAANEPGPEQDQASQYVLPVQVRDLAARADAGDARAACNLGALLGKCRHSGALHFKDVQIEQLRQQEAAAEAKGDLKAANQTAQWLLLVENHIKYCRNLPPPYLQRAPRYLRQAAFAGDPQAMVRYLRGDAFAALGSVGGHDFSGPDFRQWRREAPGMLQLLLREGRPEAALLLLEAHSTLGNNLSLITPPDPTLDQAYLWLARRLFKDLHLPDGWRESPVDAAAAREAEALARRWHAEYFRDEQLSIGTDVLDYPHPFTPTEPDFWDSIGDWAAACGPNADDGL